MIGILLDMLRVDEFYGVSEEIETAKGKYSIPMGFSDGVKQAKRKARWSKKA